MPSLPEPESYNLKDGTQIIIRPIRADDAAHLKSTFMHLSMESIYLRFLLFKKELTDEEANSLANVDYTARMAFVAICKEDGTERIVGVSRYAQIDAEHPEVVETAVVVEDDYQSRGIGKLLLKHLVNYARERGITTLRGALQIGNERMLAMVRKSGLAYQTRFVDGIWEVNVDLGEKEETK